ncbi:MAG: hypothetical protein ACRDJM_02520, partial [Actinomycetota bacterium]
MLVSRSRIASAAAVTALAFVTALSPIPSPAAPARLYMVVWAGDWNLGDNSVPDLRDRGPASRGASEAPGPDFLAVIDADPQSPAYGDVVATETVPYVENEPHHMQYVWHPGERVYAGGLFGDRTFVFDVDGIPDVRLAGVVEPPDTPCGSVPDAYWV